MACETIYRKMEPPNTVDFVLNYQQFHENFSGMGSSVTFYT